MLHVYCENRHKVAHLGLDPVDTQILALADMIQSALMLRYNKRKVG